MCVVQLVAVSSIAQLYEHFYCLYCAAVPPLALWRGCGLLVAASAAMDGAQDHSYVSCRMGPETLENRPCPCVKLDLSEVQSYTVPAYGHRQYLSHQRPCPSLDKGGQWLRVNTLTVACVTTGATG